jgi:NADP-dependent 3-hydroxy acid dehydrogenase YdfG
VVAFSSGAALRGSPLSGGYAGAKATIRFITGYAAEESARAGLGIRFVSVLPQLTAATGLGELAVAGYAMRAGMDVTTYKQQFGPMLTAEQVGDAVTAIATDPSYDQRAYLLTAAGLSLAP